MKNKLAFTLVELIVTITILAILGTIAFLSYQGYGISSRDVVRKMDISNSEKVLDLYYLKASRYPEPHDGVDVVHSGALAWVQGVLGDTTFQSLNKIYGNLRDPLTDTRYTYSVTRNRKEYQIGAILENFQENNGLSLSNQSYADSTKAFIVGNYNKLFVYATEGTNHYIISSPSIIATDLSDTSVVNIISAKKLLYNGYEGWASSYKNSFTGGIDIDIINPVVFEGTKKELGSYVGVKEINDKLKDIYYGTLLEEENREFLNSSNLTYIKSILLNIVGVNPIEPYYCNEILENSGYKNIAATGSTLLTASTTGYGTSIEGINNGIKRVDGKYDYEYHSANNGSFIQFEWTIPKEIGKLKIYNRTKCCSDRLTGSKIKLYGSTGSLLYTRTLGTTTNLDEIVVDFKLLGKIFNVKKLRIEGPGGRKINIREVEIFENEISISSGYFEVDSDGIGGSNPYEVYCDMEVSGGGRTRVGDNHIDRGDFSLGFHTPNYDQISNRENEVIPLSSPINSGYVLWSHKVSANDFSYAVRLNDFSLLKKGNELRLYAWVAEVWDQGTNINGGKGYIFNNRLRYKDNSSSTNGELETLETQIIDGRTWKYQRVIIPVTKDPKSFVWYLGKGAETGNARNFYVSGLRAEIFYK